MATTLHFSYQIPSLTDPTTIACYNLALQTFDSVVSFNSQSWQRRLDSEDATLFTASSTISSEPNSPESAANNPAIHGFLFTCHRQHPELPSPTLHISLAAVDLSHRGLGIFPRLLAMAEAHCRDEMGLESLTICTLPDKFPGMWRLLSDARNGWAEVGWRETGDGRQVLMRRGVSS
jgi:ribosomal protein S18 acetylase RimI-like enzyme